MYLILYVEADAVADLLYFSLQNLDVLGVGTPGLIDMLLVLILASALF